jgi:antitoxin component of MazEF toxin-antitoxin module
MATAHIKKVIKIGGSLAIILPAEWTKGKVEAGEEMVVIADEDLRIFPVHLKLTSQHTKDTTENA